MSPSDLVSSLALMSILLGTGSTAAQPPSLSTTNEEVPVSGTAVSGTVHGTFDVELEPQANTDAEGAVPGRMLLDKRFHGGLDASARGQMLAHRSEVAGSAVYVAIERVEGTLEGRAGTFVLHHRGVMDRGVQSLSIEVVPDSGTAELVGLRGRMTIEIKDGKHFYTFEYRVEESAH